MNWVIVLLLYIVSREWLFLNEELLFIFSFLIFVYSIYFFVGSFFSTYFDAQIEEIRKRFLDLFLIKERLLQDRVDYLKVLLDTDKAVILLSAYAFFLVETLLQKDDLSNFEIVTTNKVKAILDSVYLEQLDHDYNTYLYLEELYKKEFLHQLSINLDETEFTNSVEDIFIQRENNSSSFENKVISTLNDVTNFENNLSLLNSLAYKALLSLRVDPTLVKGQSSSKEILVSKQDLENEFFYPTLVEIYLRTTRNEEALSLGRDLNKNLRFENE